MLHVFSLLVFATNFRVKAAMKNSILLSWEIRDKNPSQPFTVRTFPFDQASPANLFVLGGVVTLVL